MVDKFILRTSDRGTFKKCRQQWDFTSKVRQNYEEDSVSKPLVFGTSIHAGLEALYDPEMWGDGAERIIAIGAFIYEWNKYQDQFDDWEETKELGIGMLKAYCDWAKDRDTFTPYKTEIEFEVPVKVSKMAMNRVANHWLFSMDGDGNLIRRDTNSLHFLPVVYQGRIDLLATDDDGFLIIDHKTAARLTDPDFLELDEQVSSYQWALNQLDIPVHSVIYNELVKSVSGPPRVLKSGKLSQDRSAATSATAYREAIDRLRLPLSDYASHLEWLENNEKELFRRTTIRRSPKELEIVGDRICLEALDMFGDPAIYPNPSKFNCDYCAFKAPCLAVNDGSDPQIILDTNYHVRTSNG